MKLPDARYVTPSELMGTIYLWSKFCKVVDNELAQYACLFLAWFIARLVSFTMDYTGLCWKEYKIAREEGKTQ